MENSSKSIDFIDVYVIIAIATHSISLINILSHHFFFQIYKAIKKAVRISRPFKNSISIIDK